MGLEGGGGRFARNRGVEPTEQCEVYRGCETWRQVLRMSKNPFPPRKDIRGDVESVNARLLEQAGYVIQVSAGVYSLTPLGTTVLNNIKGIVRSEMDTLACEISAPIMQPRSLWEKTGRLETMSSVLFGVEADGGGSGYVVSPTAEEVVTFMLGSGRALSHRDLPIAIYQDGLKFRNEARPTGGLLRGREFGMIDLYSLHKDEDDLDGYYNNVLGAYLRIFRRCGLNAFVTEASGGDYSSSISHEFMVLAEAGEDSVWACRESGCGYARNIEIDGDKGCPSCGGGLSLARAIEVGNIFKLGDRYTKAFEVTYQDGENRRRHPVMGCYGIGTTRVMASIVEVNSDENGIVWPSTVAPYDVHIVTIGQRLDVMEGSEEVINQVRLTGQTAIIDDRNTSPGVKLKDADLMGMPVRLVVSPRTVEEGCVELRGRKDEIPLEIPYEELPDKLVKLVRK